MKKKFNFNFIKLSIILIILLLIVSWMYVVKVEGADFFSLFTVKNFNHSKKFLGGMLGIGEDIPAFLSKDSWKNVLSLTYKTFQMSIMAIGFSTIGMILTVLPSSRKIVDGSITMNKKWYNWILFYIVRIIYIFSRAIPELVWAMIVIFIFKPGILPGAIALSLHNFGILGKLCSEVIRPPPPAASGPAGSPPPRPPRWTRNGRSGSARRTDPVAPRPPRHRRPAVRGPAPGCRGICSS